MAKEKDPELYERLMAAVSEALSRSTILRSSLSPSIRIEVDGDDPGTGETVRPIVSDDGEFRGFAVYPGFLRQSSYDQVYQVRRMMAFSYLSSVISYSRQLIDNYVTNPDANVVASQGFDRVVNYAVRDLTATLEDLMDMLPMPEEQDDFPMALPRTIQAEA